MRKLIEGLFGEAKEYMGLRVAKFRRLWNVEEQFLLTATVQNIKKMVKLLHRNNKKDKRVKNKVQRGIKLADCINYWGILRFEFSKLSFKPAFSLL